MNCVRYTVLSTTYHCRLARFINLFNKFNRKKCIDIYGVAVRIFICLIIKDDLGCLLDRLVSVVPGPEGSVQLVLLLLDVQVEAQHLLGHHLVRVLQDLRI